MRILFYISGHGYGHATRMAALIEAVLRVAPASTVEVRSSVPPLFFRDVKVSAPSEDIDPGMSQSSGLDVDMSATLLAHEAFVLSFDRLVACEAEYIRRSGAKLLVGDIPPLAFAAAHAAGIPSVAVGNFSWDWIFSEYSRVEERWRPIADRYAGACTLARDFFRLPFATPCPAFANPQDSPLLVRRSQFDSIGAKRSLALSKEAERRPLIFLTFGGFGSVALNFSRGEDLSDFHFIGFGPKPLGLKADWTPLPSSAPHADVVAACDVVIGKPGYGTFSESVAHGKPVLYLPRNDFPEVPYLLEGIGRMGRASQISREKFFLGNLKSDLEALLAMSVPPAVVGDGGRFIAERILA